MQAESLQLASQLTRALSDRDSYQRYAEELDQKLAKSGRESALLQQQLLDLGRQIQSLLKEIARRDDPSLPLDEDIANLPPPNEAINSIIDNNLVLYRSIPELQQQNMKLLSITRELGAKLEGDEREYKDMLDREQSEAIREAHEAIQTLQSHLEAQQKSANATIQAYVKECETLRTLAKRREQNGGLSGGINGQSSLESADVEDRIREAEGKFQSYTHEMGVDTLRLREEVSRYQREAGQLGASLAKANAKIEHINGNSFRQYFSLHIILIEGSCRTVPNVPRAICSTGAGV